MAVTCLRIGNVGPLPLDVRRLSIWISPRDLVHLIQIGLDHPDIRYEIFYGASDNAAGWWDNSRANRFGYRPQDKAEDHRAMPRPSRQRSDQIRSAISSRAAVFARQSSPTT